VATGTYLLFPRQTPPAGGSYASPPDVLNAVRDGRVLLVDLRRPDEWERTGLAEGAVPIDMRRPDFIEAVRQARVDATQPVAVICARGVRSQRMTTRLIEAGIKPILDVPEGMLGSFAGPGWLKRGLPVVAWTR
jgi:rhodanese-related sulfurtransferase